MSHFDVMRQMPDHDPAQIAATCHLATVQPSTAPQKASSSRAFSRWFLVVLTWLGVQIGAPTIALAAETPGQEPSRAVKVGLLRQLTEPPEIVILGSSVAMRANPSRLRSLTARTAFNASVSSGSIADAYCFAHLVRQRFPGTRQRFVWFLNIEKFRERYGRVEAATFAQPELAQFIPSQFPSPFAGLSLPPAPPVYLPPVSPPFGDTVVMSSSGWLRWSKYDYRFTQGRTVADGVAYSCRKYRSIYTSAFHRLERVPQWFLRETIRSMNKWGTRPVIVLPPYHPKLLKTIQSRGFGKRKRAVLRVFGNLRREGLRFVLIDMTHIDRFGGRSSRFYDGVHMRSTETSKLLRAVVEMTGNLLVKKRE